MAGDCIVGTGLAVLPPKRLGEVSASQTILWLEGHAGELVEVEEEHHENYTAFFHSKEATSQPKEIIALVIRPSSPIYAEFRSKLEPA